MTRLLLLGAAFARASKSAQGVLAVCLLAGATPAAAATDVDGYDCRRAAQRYREKIPELATYTDRQVVEEMSTVTGGSVETAAQRMGCVPPTAKDLDAYNRCVVTSSKPGIDKRTINSIEAACERAATPKKCRDMSPSAAAQCAKACANANIYSRQLGECAFSNSL